MLGYLANAPAGTAAGLYTSGTVTVVSSIDNIALSTDYCYDNGFQRRPILVLMHGYSEDTTALTTTTRQRFASLGFFVVIPNMRGRGTDTGTQDDSGREIRDIYDAVLRVRALFPSFVHPTRNAIAGYSGGGGNTEACLAKLPDFFTTFVSYYGISDYGWDSVSSWRIQNPSFAALIATHVGGTFAAVPNNYRARYHTEAIPYQMFPSISPGPRLYLFHDSADVTVQIPLSDTLRDAINALSLQDKLEFHRSTPADAERYIHGYPDVNPGDLAAERYWTPRARDADAWTVPPFGTAWVSGWIKTRRFEIWIGDGATPMTDALGGTTHAAKVVYSVTPTNSTFIVTLVTGPSNVYVLDSFGRQTTVAVPLNIPTTITL